MFLLSSCDVLTVIILSNNYQFKPMFINLLRFTKALPQKLPPTHVTYRPKPRHALLLTSISYLAYHLYEAFWNTSLQFCHHPDAAEKDLLTYLRDIRYTPTFYIPHRFLQLTYATRIEKPIELHYERQLLKLPDGGQVALDWLNRDKATTKPLILITHGLTGGSDQNYIKYASQQLSQQGYQVVCFNQRGVANCELLTSRYHFHGCTQDLKEVITYLDSIKQEGQQIYAVGFSIGANLLLKYAGQEKEQCKISRIVSVANPYNLLTCSFNILRLQNKIYDWSITENFKWLLAKNRHILAENEQLKGIEVEKALKAQNTYEFDELVTRRLFGFTSPEDLYKAIGCEDYISGIKVPVFCLHAKDDPIVPQNIIPVEKIKQNPNIILAITNKGAHVEWFSGLVPQRWIMKPILRYLELNSK